MSLPVGEPGCGYPVRSPTNLDYHYAHEKVELTLLTNRQPGTPRSREKAQSIRDADASKPMVEQSDSRMITETIIAALGRFSVAWRNTDMNGNC